MRIATTFIGAALAMLLVGCASQPYMSFEESLVTKHAMRNDVPDWNTFMRYRVGFVYANAARNQLQAPTLIAPADPSFDFQIPFGILDYAQGDKLGAGLSLIDWFNSGLSEESTYGWYYNRGLGFMGHPNTHYFTFDERPGEATAEDIYAAWDEAYALFQAIHNRSGACYVHGYSDKHGYRRTYSKNVPGRYRELSYWCPHPVLDDREYRVAISVYASPYRGVRVLAGVQPQCYRPIKGEKFIDARGCGISLADQQRDLIPDSRFGWLELIVTPTADNPNVFEVVARSDDDQVVLPAPQAKDKYAEFLASRPYKVK